MGILGEIQAAIQAACYRITSHAADELLDDGIGEQEILAATLAGEVIEDYPSAFPFPACLVLGRLPGTAPVHAVWAFDGVACYAFLVTAYRPDPARWTSDFRKRMKR
jgi:hypothetical protein